MIIALGILAIALIVVMVVLAILSGAREQPQRVRTTDPAVARVIRLAEHAANELERYIDVTQAPDPASTRILIRSLRREVAVYFGEEPDGDDQDRYK